MLGSCPLDPVAGTLINGGDLSRIYIIADRSDLLGKRTGERVADITETHNADGGVGGILALHSEIHC